MKAYAIVLACGVLALTVTSFIELISGWGPLVMLCLFMALVTVWMIRAENDEQRAHDSFKKAA